MAIFFFYGEFLWRILIFLRILSLIFMANFNIFTNFYLKFLWRILWRTSATFCLVTLTHQTDETLLTEKCHFTRKNLASGESGWFGFTLDTRCSFKRVQGFSLACMCQRKVTALIPSFKAKNQQSGKVQQAWGSQVRSFGWHLWSLTDLYSKFADHG